MNIIIKIWNKIKYEYLFWKVYLSLRNSKPSIDEWNKFFSPHNMKVVEEAYDED